MMRFGRAMFLGTPGDVVTVRAHGSSLAVVFFRHDWSGIVEVTVGDQRYVLDLYSATGVHWVFEAPLPADEVPVSVRLRDEKHPRSQAMQAWIEAVYVVGATPPTAPWVRLNDRLSFVRGVEGDFLILNSDTAISRFILDYGLWAANDVILFKRLVGPGMSVADIGANLGHHTVVFSKLVGPTGRVVACEPQRLLFQLLSGNLALNGCTNVVARQCAVGDEADRVELWPIDYDRPNNFGALGVSRHQGELKRDQGGEAVDLVVTADLLAPFRPLDFVKVDVQSYELFVLRGALPVLRDDRPTLFVEMSPFWMRHTGYDYREVYALLIECGYRLYDPHGSHAEPVGIRQWSGDRDEEWDVLAIHPNRRPTSPASAGDGDGVSG
jgi:FkbM family methyltransferase